MSEKTSLGNRLYSALAGETPGSGAKEFIKNLGLIGVSFAAAKVISGLVTILAGRLLGPEEYGRINVMASAGAALAPFMLVGLNYSVVKYGSVPEERPRVFGSALAAFAALGALISVLTIIFSRQLAALFHIDRGMLFFSLFYAAATAAFLLTSSMQQALGRFSRRGLGEIGFSVIMAAVFAGGVLYLGRVYQAMAWAYVAAFGGTALFWLYKTRQNVRPEGFSQPTFTRMSKYGFYNFGASLGGVLLLNIQGLIINASLSARDTGIYAAYYTAAINIGGYLAYALATVLFPKASSASDLRRVWEMAVRSWLRLWPVVLLLFVLVEYIILSLMGKHQYGMDPKLMLLFAICGTLILVWTTFGHIALAAGVKASRLVLFLSLGAGALNLAACMLIVPRFGVEGATLAFILSHALMIGGLGLLKDEYLKAGAGNGPSLR